MYFLWERNIPYFNLATSIPKKYLSPPRFFILNSTINCSWNLVISSILSPIIIISSTYIIRAINFPNKLFKNKVWSELLYWNPYFFIAMLKWLNHMWGDCFSSYRAHCNLHTTRELVDVVYPSGTSM